MVNVCVKKLLGIDPGLKGALALIDERGKLITTQAMPTYMLKRSKGEKQMVDEVGVFAFLDHHRPDEIWIEDVWSSSQMGVVSAFTFGEGKGILKGACAGIGVRPRYVPPATWKAVMGLSADKNTSKRRARTLFPDAGKLLSTADKCEAALIALYGLCASK